MSSLHGRVADEMVEALLRLWPFPNDAPFLPQLILEKRQREVKTKRKKRQREIGQRDPDDGGMMSEDVRSKLSGDLLSTRKSDRALHADIRYSTVLPDAKQSCAHIFFSFNPKLLFRKKKTTTRKYRSFTTER